MTVCFIIMSVIAILLVFVAYYFKIKAVIKGNIPDAIESAEQMDKIGAEKMQEAYEQIIALVPTMFKPFFSETVVKGFIQIAFDKIKAFAEKQNKE